MHNLIANSTKGFNVYVEPGYITKSVPAGMVLLDFRDGTPIYGINLNGRVVLCNSLMHAVKILMNNAFYSRNTRK